MRIGDLALATGVSPQTIRFYERRGLLPSPARELNGYRHYDDAIAGRLRFIRAAQTAGLTLAEIGSVTDLRQAGEAPCAHVFSLLRDKLEAVQARQRELAVLEGEVQQLISASNNLDPADCSPGSVCQLIPQP